MCGKRESSERRATRHQVSEANSSKPWALASPASSLLGCALSRFCRTCQHVCTLSCSMDVMLPSRASPTARSKPFSSAAHLKAEALNSRQRLGASVPRSSSAAASDGMYIRILSSGLSFPFLPPCLPRPRLCADERIAELLPFSLRLLRHSLSIPSQLRLALNHSPKPLDSAFVHLNAWIATPAARLPPFPSAFLSSSHLLKYVLWTKGVLPQTVSPLPRDDPFRASELLSETRGPSSPNSFLSRGRRSHSALHLNSPPGNAEQGRSSLPRATNADQRLSASVKRRQ